MLNVRNVNDGYYEGLKLLQANGISVPSRNGDTLEYPGTVVTEYRMPTEQVLFCPIRNANPFFHLMEAIWVLAGRNDVQFLLQYNKRMIDYSDNGFRFHAPYGFRIASQLPLLIALLKNEPTTRRAVLQIWQHEVDLNVQSKDIPCNDIIFFRPFDGQLNMTVCCRSNDIIWGCYGSNYVQFTTLLQYVAGAAGFKPGTYTQVSNSFHAYTDVFDKKVKAIEQPFEQPYDIPTFIGEPYLFDNYDEVIGECKKFCNGYDGADYANKIFTDLLIPMSRAYKLFRDGNVNPAYDCMIYTTNGFDDWVENCRQWLQRKMK